MEIAAMIVFGVSILCISALFYIKHWEEKEARVFVPGLRLAADGKALEFKELLVRFRGEFRKFGPTSIRIGRVILHDLALSLAALSRASERQAHRLADMLSHKHTFQRRETRNDFLKQVSDVPMRNSREIAATTAPTMTSAPPAPPANTPAHTPKKGRSKNQSLETEK
jgi:hypothetical protein